MIYQLYINIYGMVFRQTKTNNIVICYINVEYIFGILHFDKVVTTHHSHQNIQKQMGGFQKYSVSSKMARFVF